MKPQDERRREFLRQSILAVGAATLPMRYTYAATLYQRQDWQTFKNTPQFSSLKYAIGRMIANGNSADPNSWSFWVNIHVKYCPHGLPYFFAWHRGYLWFFERQIRAITGDPNLVLPYWDYYANPNLPSEFTFPTTGNPFWTKRTNTNVRAALSLAPFSPSVINFPRNFSNPFEPNFENAPHNPVHDIIGGWMPTMQSPFDPIFWLHHSNVDRMWVAWVAAGGGRAMPLKTNSYWSGSFRYTNDWTMTRLVTYDTRTYLTYNYQNEFMPTRLPSLEAGASVLSAPSDQAQPALAIPPVGSYALSTPRATSDATYSAGGSLNIDLSERSVSVQLPVSAEYGSTVAQIARGNAATAPGGATQFKAIHLVLDNVEMTANGRNGGYFYQIYVNLPSRAGVAGAPGSKLVGTLGPFKIAAAEHHHGGPSQLRYALTELLAGLAPAQIGLLTVSFVRVDGDNSPTGDVIGIGETRIELSADSNAP